MGADLIGYLVTGPRKFTALQQRTAIKAAKRLAMLDTFTCDCGTGIEVTETMGDTCSNCGTRFPDIRSAQSDPAAYVKRFTANWPPQYRDVAFRHDPRDKHRLIVFAGEMSWGDTPDGAGYRYLEELLASGIAEALEVE